jgi:hypothetical protein
VKERNALAVVTVDEANASAVTDYEYSFFGYEF